MLDPHGDRSTDPVHVGLPIAHDPETDVDEIVLTDDEEEAERTGYSITVTPGEVESVTEPNADDLLEQFSEKWQVADAVTDADVLEVTTELGLARSSELLTVDETVQNETLPQSEAEELVETAVPIEERYGHLPSSPETTTIQYAEQDVEAVECRKCSTTGSLQCPKCSGSGKNQCAQCGGSGTTNCSNCGGTGTVADGDGGTSRCRSCRGDGTGNCSSCSGSGVTRCSRCSGSGTITCGACGGDGATISLQHGTLETSVDEVETAFAETVPASNVETASESVTVEERTKRLSQPSPGTETTVLEELTVSLTPVVTVTYELDEERYELYSVGGDLSAADSHYPASRKRGMLPYAIGALVVLAAVGGYAFNAGWFG